MAQVCTFTRRTSASNLCVRGMRLCGIALGSGEPPMNETQLRGSRGTRSSRDTSGKQIFKDLGSLQSAQPEASTAPHWGQGHQQ